MFDFAGQRILVAGGSSGIGLASAQMAAQYGAQVTIAARSPERLTKAVAQIGHGAQHAVLDLIDAEAVARFGETSGIWDHIIVTGSDVKIAPVRDLPLPDARQAFDSKFWGFYHLARSARIAPGGSLSVVAGFLATRPVAGRALMGAINGALESLVQGLALELKPVRVNAVSPAVVAGGMWSHMSQEDQAAMYARIGATYPAGRVGAGEEIARQLLLLAATGYATGTIVTLDGGASIA
ncbi:SDR family oxidoreductase [Novosphingobium sp. KACC 22771]|uniref:SDR family oxidoreductase n=1 Tax=Novosphingobium sp. KACC 22771 TaxID=3025670 RepID=UPI002366C5EC|nr:SDR family oxidoreductase [Novosphingobium sp. KACC 22771]WDF71442.1 SDR family oxidoreductase [Novosphingobium sp. KACC 22771]